MALKGKKKSRARGSQARRRPASAPRPAYGSREKPPWYQTTQGMVIGFLVMVSLVIFVWWWVADSRNESQARSFQRESLQTYTSDLRTLIQNLTPIAAEISASGTLSDKELEKSAKAWKDQLAQITVVNGMTPPDGLGSTSRLVDVVMRLYDKSVQQFALVPRIEGKISEQVSDGALDSYLAANDVLAGIIETVDEARAEADLAASGLIPPGAQEMLPTPTLPPTPTPNG